MCHFSQPTVSARKPICRVMVRNEDYPFGTSKAYFVPYILYKATEDKLIHSTIDNYIRKNITIRI